MTEQQFRDVKHRIRMASIKASKSVSLLAHRLHPSTLTIDAVQCAVEASLLAELGLADFEALSSDHGPQNCREDTTA